MIPHLVVPSDPNYRFYLAKTNPFGHFTYQQVRQGSVYNPDPNSKLIALPQYIPHWIEKPLLYWKYIPTFF